MTLEDAKALLQSNGIPFEICRYKDEAEYFRHLTMFPGVNKAGSCRITAIVIRCKNGHKDIELQFTAADQGDVFAELHFGGYAYELFELKEELLPGELIRNINAVLQGRAAVIEINNIRRKRWLGDIYCDREEDDFEQSYLKKTLDRISKPPSFIERILHVKRQYEIYDYENYQCIIR